MVTIIFEAPLVDHLTSIVRGQKPMQRSTDKLGKPVQTTGATSDGVIYASEGSGNGCPGKPEPPLINYMR